MGYRKGGAGYATVGRLHARKAEGRFEERDGFGRAVGGGHCWGLEM